MHHHRLSKGVVLGVVVQIEGEEKEVAVARDGVQAHEDLAAWFLADKKVVEIGFQRIALAVERAVFENQPLFIVFDEGVV